MLEAWEGVGLWLGAEQGGVGLGGAVRPRPLAAASREMLSAGCYTGGVCELSAQPSTH